MKVAIDVVPIRTTGETGGAFQLVIELIRGLVKLNDSDKFYLLTAEWNHEFFKQFDKYGVERICVYNASTSKVLLENSIYKRALRKLYNLVTKKIPYLKYIKYSTKSVLRSRSIDVLFCPMSAVNYSEPGIPVLSLIHDLQHEYYPQFFSDSENATRKKFYNEICNLADYIVSVSEYTRKTVIEKLNFAEDKTKVIYNCIQGRVKVESDEIDSILEKFGFLNKKYAFYPANFWPHKNHKVLLLAFSILLKEHPDLDVHLCLTGSLLQQDSQFAEMIEQMGLSTRVKHLGYVSEKEVSALMSRAHFMIFPSLFEGFGIPVAEAMMTGTPVLCSNSTSLPEVGGEAALYFDPRRPIEIANQMNLIFTNENLRADLIKKGFEQVKKFDRDSMIKQYYELLKKVSKDYAKEKSSLSGVYGDNWSSSVLTISVGKESSMKRVLYLEVILPSVSPHKNGVIHLLIGKKKRKIVFEKDTLLKIEEELPNISSDVTIIFQNTFRPTQIGIEDDRELGAQVQKIVIKEKDTGIIIRSLHGVET